MKRKIAVEGSLRNVSQDLQTNGYEVVDLNDQNIQDADAVVITGEDRNVMNMSDIKTKAPVINARGRTAGQVRSEIENKI